MLVSSKLCSEDRQELVGDWFGDSVIGLSALGGERCNFKSSFGSLPPPLFLLLIFALADLPILESKLTFLQVKTYTS
ncbi:hypothetical protein Hanom_Chr11g01050271 [Helianthus anomalus]